MEAAAGCAACAPPAWAGRKGVAAAGLRLLPHALLTRRLLGSVSQQGESVFDRDQAVAKRTTVMPPLPEDRFLCGFSHIFAGGYSAG